MKFGTVVAFDELLNIGCGANQIFAKWPLLSRWLTPIYVIVAIHVYMYVIITFWNVCLIYHTIMNIPMYSSVKNVIW
jgi:hypothetical protein